MYGILLAIHIVVAVFLIGFILIQQGKGAQAGAAFGNGASQTIFGSQGSGGFLSRTTAYLAVIFFILNLVLAFVVNREVRLQSMENLPAPVKQMPVAEKPLNDKSTSDVPLVE